jgi:hypothetical protein
MRRMEVRSLAWPPWRNDHGAMRLPLLALFLGAACQGPPRIPFDEGPGWHIAARSGERYSNDRFISQYNASAIEVFLPAPGSQGWGWEFEVNWGQGEGKDNEKIRTVVIDDPNDPQNFVTQTLFQSVPDERRTDFYGLSVGVRQVFLPDSIVQPYFGVGGSLFKTKNVDNLDVPPPPSGFLYQDPQPRTVEHFQTVDFGFYMHTGLQWRILRDTIRKDSEMLLSLDLRGSLGHEFSFFEVGFGVGYGR